MSKPFELEDFKTAYAVFLLIEEHMDKYLDKHKHEYDIFGISEILNTEMDIELTLTKFRMCGCCPDDEEKVTVCLESFYDFLKETGVIKEPCCMRNEMMGECDCETDVPTNN